LSQAIERTLTTHPELRLYRSRETSLEAAAETAAQRPPLSPAVDAENFGGTGATSAADSAEITLSLASVLERGGKREARRAVAAIQLDAVELARETTSLDLTAEVARRGWPPIRCNAVGSIGSDRRRARRKPNPYPLPLVQQPPASLTTLCASVTAAGIASGAR
jgi:outer membrane efflux protein